MGDWITPIKDPVMAMAVKLWGYVPNVLAAIVIFIVGILVAKVVVLALAKVLQLSKLDLLSEKSGLNKILQTGEVRLTLSGIIETLIYWILVLIVVVTAAQALKFTAAVALMTRLIAYIPNIIAAVLILAVGAFVASILGSIVSTAAKNAGLKKANILVKLVKIAVVIFAITIALEQLNIAAALITQIVTVLVLSVGAGFAIAFGLGCKDLVAKSVTDFLNGLK